LLILVATGSALAASAPTAAMNIPKFLAHQEQLRADLAESPRFEHMDNESKRRIYASQEVLFTVLRDKASIGDLSDDERLQVFDAQNAIAAVLTDAEEDRPLCKNAPRLGSHMKNLDCWSKRERALQREVTQHELMRTRTCVNEPGCSQRD
jgi:hypothetical protein